MSSVGSSDSSQRAQDNDTVRRTREDGKEKETELVKKQAKELRRVNEAHYAEVERLKQDHTAQMADLHKVARQEISARDHKYQSEIEEMRAMHRKEAERNANENQRREETSKSVNKNDSSTQKKYTDERMEKLNEDFRNQTAKLSEHYQEAIKSGREKQNEAIERSRERQQKANELEKSVLRKDRDEKVQELGGQYSSYREFTNQERQDTQVKHMQENKRASENLMHAVAKERQAGEDQADILRDGFKDGLEDTRERYDKARKAERQALNMSENDLKSMAVNRIDNQVRRLELENRDLKEANVRDQLKRENAKRQEVKNIQDEYGKNIDNYKDQRDEILSASNKQSAKDISKVRGEYDKQAVENGRFYRDKADEQNRIFRTAYDNMKGDFSARLDQNKNSTDERIQRIVEGTNEDKGRLIQLQEEQHVSSQRVKADQLKNLRDAMTDEKTQTVNRLQDQMRKQEIQHSERMAQVVGKYEKQITTLKDQMLREKKMNDENTKRLTDELARVHKMEVDQVEAKNREKVRVMGSQHSEELRMVNKRHEEKLDQVIGEMKKS